MEMKIYPVCARCSIVMNPNAFDDVAPGFLINGECYCPECAKDWLKDEVDSDPEAGHGDRDHRHPGGLI